MKEDYFAHHYSRLNRIDPDSEASVRQWLEASKLKYGREIGAWLQDVEGKKILELGCGIGGTMSYLFSLGASDVTGVDRSEDQLAVCRKYVTGNVEQADVIDFMERTAEEYDYVIALDLIEHLPKERIPVFCRLLHKVLKPGGTAIVRTPNMGSLFAARYRYVDFTHEVGFTEESIAQVLRGAGFQSVSVHNGYIGKRRLTAVRLFQRMLEKLYNIEFTKTVTMNMVVTARK